VLDAGSVYRSALLIIPKKAGSRGFVLDAGAGWVDDEVLLGLGDPDRLPGVLREPAAVGRRPAVSFEKDAVDVGDPSAAGGFARGDGDGE
jgi:hypothetical protein